MQPRNDQRRSPPGLPKRERPPLGRSLERLFEKAPVQTLRQTQVLVLMGVPLFVVLGLATHYASISAVAVIVGALTMLLLGPKLYAGDTSLRSFVLALLATAALTASSYFIVSLMRSRFFTSLVLASVTLLLFWLRSQRVVDFFPKPGGIHDKSSLDDSDLPFRITGRPRLWPLALVLAIVVYVPLAHSTTLAIAAVMLILVASLLIEAARTDEGPGVFLMQAWPRFNRLRNEFLKPTARWEEDPKVLAAAARRRLDYLGLAISAMLTLIIGLSFCCPWELFAKSFSPSFHWILASDTPYQPFEWLAPFWRPADAGIGYWTNVLVGIPLLLTLPELLLLVVFAPAMRSRAAAPVLAEKPAAQPSSPNEWERNVQLIADSKRILEFDPSFGLLRTESENLFLGTRVGTGEPIVLDRAILHEHVYIVGQTGSGKTALGIMPLLIQLIRGYEHPVRKDGQLTDQWDPAPHAPIVILDLKGDLALYNTARLEADKLGRTFLFFSADGRKVTHRFNPFNSIYAEPRTPIEVCELLIQAMNLFHGEQYGASYYSRQHRDLLLTAIDEIHKAGKKITSWDQLYQIVHARYDKRRFRDAVDLLTVIHALTFYDQLDFDETKHAGEPHIRMPNVLNERQIVYFWLPSLLVNMSVREIAKLALYTYLTAASDYNSSLNADQPPLHSYVIIDEFQRIAAENMSVILQQVRTAYVSLILANQDPSDLKLPDVDLRSTVKTNTRMRQYFTVTDPREIEELVLLSGEEIDYLQTETVDVSKQVHYDDRWFGARTGHSIGEKRSEGTKEVVRPRLQMNEIIAMNNAQQQSLVHIVRDAGVTHLEGLPTRVETPWPLDRAEYERRRRTPWPKRTPSTGQIEPTKTPEQVDLALQNQRQEMISKLKGAVADELANEQSDIALLTSAKKEERQRPTKSQREKNKAKYSTPPPSPPADDEGPYDAQKP